MRLALESALVHPVHLLRRKRNRRRVEPHFDVAVALHERARIAGIGLRVQDPRRVRVQYRIRSDLLEGWHADDASRAIGAAHTPRTTGHGGGRHLVDRRRVDLRPPLRHRATDECGTAKVPDCFDPLPRSQAMRQLHDLPLGVAEDEQVCFRVKEDRAAHFLRPVVEVRNPAQRGFDAADHDRHVAIRLAHALRVDDHRPIGPLAALPARRVRVVAAHAPVGGVAVHHRIHVAGGDAEEQVRATESLERLCIVPVRLRDDADTKALCLECAADDGHTEARMVDICVARDEDHVAGVPAKRLHLRARHRQEWRRAEARRPVLAVAGDVARRVHRQCVAPCFGAECFRSAASRPGTKPAPTGTSTLEPAKSSPTGS